jgi:cytoplasmic iron level regulating protein YaaA (DUF328/UPF0246 family)
MGRDDAGPDRVVAWRAVLVLLPPSEGKTAPRRGRPADLGALVHPELTPAREALLDALDPGLRAARAARASQVYTGVLFQHLRLAELPARARKRVLIASALWGVVRPDDRIPAYKLPIGDRLPGLPALAAYWRPRLTEVLPDAGFVLDLRSGAYAAAWTPRRATLLGVRAFVERDGTRTPVSHMVKATRGTVARIALEASPPPRSPAAVAALVEAAGHRVELTDATLDVIEAG